MLHITRYHNAISSVAYMRRMTNLAMDYGKRRFAFGTNVIKKPLHVLMLSKMELDTRGNLLFVLEISRLLGLVDVGKATEQDTAVLRVSSSLLKLFTAKEGVRLTSEGVECFGGVGVMENSHIPVLLRDSQVLPIWEGTTNILSLDLLRACHREPKAIECLENYLNENAKGASDSVTKTIENIFGFLKESRSFSPQLLEFNARKLSFNMSRLIITTLAHRVYSDSQSDGISQYESMDKALLDHWTKRMEMEFEPLDLQISTDEINKQFLELFSDDIGEDVDSRGEMRSRL